MSSKNGMILEAAGLFCFQNQRKRPFSHLFVKCDLILTREEKKVDDIYDRLISSNSSKLNISILIVSMYMSSRTRNEECLFIGNCLCPLSKPIKIALNDLHS